MSHRPWFRSRPSEFWRIWLTAALFIAVALFLFGTSHAWPAEVCRASWYGSEMGHARTASGERWQPMRFTAAHRTLPLGSVISVRANGHSVILRVSDRGPARRTGRCLDVSERAAIALGMKARGTALVQIERLQ